MCVTASFQRAAPALPSRSSDFPGIALDEKGLIPKWVLGWISGDPLIRKLQFSLVILGPLAIWFVVKFAKFGVLEDIVKPAYNEIPSKFSFPRPWKRFRR